MLVLSRKSQESVVVASSDGHSCLVKVTIIAVRGDRVRIGFEAPLDVPVHRWEVWQRMVEQQDLASDGESDGNKTSGRHGGKADESASAVSG
ncbi:MAG TPA: carbon storage regulator [Pirellulales bacterium]|nr:carbon storage regulator [Pirellulales bacterium]